MAPCLLSNKAHWQPVDIRIDSVELLVYRELCATWLCDDQEHPEIDDPSLGVNPQVSICKIWSGSQSDSVGISSPQ